ncbi:hypothetical protein JND47_14905 [Listeria monocytogenes]|nr:hypothetical protein [Listeria monocytogenes]
MNSRKAELKMKGKRKKGKQRKKKAVTTQKTTEKDNKRVFKYNCQNIHLQVKKRGLDFIRDRL